MENHFVHRLEPKRATERQKSGKNFAIHEHGDAMEKGNSQNLNVSFQVNGTHFFPSTSYQRPHNTQQKENQAKSKENFILKSFIFIQKANNDKQRNEGKNEFAVIFLMEFSHKRIRNIKGYSVAHSSVNTFSLLHEALLEWGLLKFNLQWRCLMLSP